MPFRQFQTIAETLNSFNTGKLPLQHLQIAAISGSGLAKLTLTALNEDHLETETILEKWIERAFNLDPILTLTIARTILIDRIPIYSELLLDSVYERIPHVALGLTGKYLREPGRAAVLLINNFQGLSKFPNFDSPNKYYLAQRLFYGCQALARACEAHYRESIGEKTDSYFDRPAEIWARQAFFAGLLTRVPHRRGVSNKDNAAFLNSCQALLTSRLGFD